MITLHIFGPNLGLPDASPFCMKADVLLKMAGLAYEVDTKGFGKAPKGKQPYLVDDGRVVADSTFIRDHIERKYAFDFDEGLSVEQRGFAWATEKMCEDHLYWAIVHDRWMDDGNFAKGPAHFDAVPAPLRPLVQKIVRRGLRKALRSQGFGRHSGPERDELARRDIDALAAQLGDKSYLFGERPVGADATVFGFLASALCPILATAMRKAAENHPSLVAYRDRMMNRYYPSAKPA